MTEVIFKPNSDPLLVQLAANAAEVQRDRYRGSLVLKSFDVSVLWLTNSSTYGDIHICVLSVMSTLHKTRRLSSSHSKRVNNTQDLAYLSPDFSTTSLDIFDLIQE